MSILICWLQVIEQKSWWSILTRISSFKIQSCETGIGWGHVTKQYWRSFEIVFLEKWSMQTDQSIMLPAHCLYKKPPWRLQLGMSSKNTIWQSLPRQKLRDQAFKWISFTKLLGLPLDVSISYSSMWSHSASHILQQPVSNIFFSF